MRKFLTKRVVGFAAAAVTLGAFSLPAHAETIVIDVTVSQHLGAVAYGSSDKVGETFTMTLSRAGVSDGVPDTSIEDNGTDTVNDIAGVTTGVEVYTITAATSQGENFTALVTCVKAAGGTPVCTPSVGIHLVITIVSNIIDG